MTYLSFIDKIKLLFSLLFDFKGILIFSALMFIFTILYLIKKINIKRYTIGIGLSLLLVLLISIISNYKILSNTFDDFFTVFFRGIYFPSIYLYISTLVIVLFTFIFSLINVKLKRVYKIINKVMFVINTILFAIIINIIAKDKVDIFSINSLYSNTKLVGILEISMNVFLLWIGSLFVSYITNLLSDRMASKKETIKEVSIDKPKKNITFNQENAYIMVDNPFPKKDYKTNKDELLPSISYISKHIPEEIHLVEGFAPDGIYEEDNSINDVKEEIISEKEINNYEDEIIEESNEKNSITFNDLLNGTIPVSYYDNKKEETEYTLSNPQEIYEGHYNSIINEINKDTSKEEVIEEIDNTPVIEETKENTPKDVIVTITKEVKGKEEDNLLDETVSLNDLVDDDMKKANDSYTVDDYKKIISMLNTLKKNGIDHNITIDDAVALSLINNYSIDDCLKFKDILESYLN